MTHRERFIKTLRGEPIGGQVPTFELVFFLTMEAFGKVHPHHRKYEQWDQMSENERKLQIADMADVYIQTAQRYGHSAIHLHPNPGDLENTQRLLEEIRRRTGDQYFLTIDHDPTWAIPDGDHMMDFSVRMFEEPEALNDQSARRLEETLEIARKLDEWGHLLDGFCFCSDYCFNVNPFFSPDQFEEFIVPTLRDAIAGAHEMGYYVIKHTAGNIMPILPQIAACKPDALHSLDPQGGVSIPEVRKVIGDDICLIGNVNCGLLQTGTEEECRQDVLRALREGMEKGRGYVFATSNCAYTGLPLARYEAMIDLWRQYGSYDR